MARRALGTAGESEGFAAAEGAQAEIETARKANEPAMATGMRCEDGERIFNEEGSESSGRVDHAGVARFVGSSTVDVRCGATLAHTERTAPALQVTTFTVH